MTEIVDLWPDIIKVEKMITPVTILRQQASLLGKKTKNIVQGKVADSTNKIHPTEFAYSFYIVAPALNNYRHKLLEIYYEISLYPLIVVVDEDIRKDISSRFRYKFKSMEIEQTKQIDFDKIFGSATEVKESVKANSEEDFYQILREIFNSTKVKRIISVLLSQSDPSYDPSLKEDEAQQQ